MKVRVKYSKSSSHVHMVAFLMPVAENTPCSLFYQSQRHVPEALARRAIPLLSYQHACKGVILGACCHQTQSCADMWTHCCQIRTKPPKLESRSISFLKEESKAHRFAI